MRKILFIVILAISIFVINNLIRSIFTLWQKHDLVTIAQKELARQRQENQRLKSELSHVQSKEFIEQEARNKLFLLKPGEQEVLISEDLIKGSATSSAQKKEQAPNWKKWWELFF